MRATLQGLIPIAASLIESAHVYENVTNSVLYYKWQSVSCTKSMIASIFYSLKYWLKWKLLIFKTEWIKSPYNICIWIIKGRIRNPDRQSADYLFVALNVVDCRACGYSICKAYQQSPVKTSIETEVPRFRNKTLALPERSRLSGTSSAFLARVLEMVVVSTLEFIPYQNRKCVFMWQK